MFVVHAKLYSYTYVTRSYCNRITTRSTANTDRRLQRVYRSYGSWFTSIKTPLGMTTKTCVWFIATSLDEGARLRNDVSVW